MSGTGERYDPDPEEYEPEVDLRELGSDQPEADALEQHQPADPDDRDDYVTTILPEVPEADALDQARVAQVDDEDDYT
jgi:hypothetical protein